MSQRFVVAVVILFCFYSLHTVSFELIMCLANCTSLVLYRSMRERRQILEKNVTVIPNKIMLSETNLLKVLTLNGTVTFYFVPCFCNTCNIP